MMLFSGGQPPGPHAGDMSALTGMLRPTIGLTPDQCQTARRMRRAGREVNEIAAKLDVSEENVRQALATLRTRARSATRRSLNVTLAAHDYVVGEAMEGEACWETMDRLLAEFAFKRAMSGSPPISKPVWLTGTENWHKTDC